MKQSGAWVGGLAVRAMLALAAAGCAVPAYRYAEVATLRANAPLDASRIAPHDAKALANALGSRFDSNPEFKPSARDLADIRATLVEQPLEPKLLGILGLAYEASGGPKRATEVMGVANRASRRDVVSQLYLIESASASGDVQATLRHYNVALLTHPELRETLLPILAAAITFPEVRSAVLPYLKSRVDWSWAFLRVASEKSSVADLKSLLSQVKGIASDPLNYASLSTVLRRAALEGSREDLAFFANYLVPGLRFEVLLDFGVNSRTTDPRLGTLAWNFPAVENIALERDGDQAITINADPLARGVVAVRDFLLEGGRAYHLNQNVSFAAEQSRPTLRWTAACARSNADPIPFWDQVQVNTHNAPAPRNTFTVPADCKLIRMALIIEGPDGQVPASVTLDKLELLKAQ